MKHNKILLVLGAIAVMLLLIFVFIRDQNPRYSWQEDYEEEKKPYGTHIIYKLLQSYYPSFNFHEIETGIAEDLPSLDSLNENIISNYIFIGEGLFLDSVELNRVLDFVSAGNNVFMSSKDIPFEIKTTVFEELCSDYWFYNYPQVHDTTALLNFQHPELRVGPPYKYTYISHNETRRYRWHYVESSYFCDEYYSPVILGNMNDSLVNFYKMGYGLGDFYFHTTPLAFSNIHLLDSTAVEYAASVFSHLPEGDIYWDAVSRLPLGVARSLDRNNRDGAMDRGLSNEGPLSFILSQPPLAWAWYTGLTLAVLFLVFQSRRKQRIIPVAKPNKNTSLEFINTIGRMYFHQGNHRKLSLKKMTLFLSFVRNRYYLETNDLDKEFVDRLAAKSDIPTTLIDKILLFHKNISSSNFVSEKTLIEFHKEMEKFYKNCK